MYKYLEEHAYISKNKKSNYQFELSKERAECIANKYNSLCEEKDTEIERLNSVINELSEKNRNLLEDNMRLRKEIYLHGGKLYISDIEVKNVF